MSALVASQSQQSPRDPYEIERLADELAAREAANPPSEPPDHSPNSGTDILPLYTPLSHDNPYLAAEHFDVEEFLLSRAHTSLQDLRAELRNYLSTLKEALVKLINDDYEAFISLSTDLRGEGPRLEKLKYPLGYLRAQILTSKGELCVIQAAIQEKLDKRAILREEKALLHLLLKISESVNRLESLLLIAAPAHETSSSAELAGLGMPRHLTAEETNHEDRSQGGRAKHLGRVAGEYTQLLYHASKARSEKCLFVNEIQWRIDRIQSTLSSDLDHLFTTVVTSLAGTKSHSKPSDIDRSKLLADLTECLRTYDALGLWRDPEDILRREVVRAFVKKTIHPSALTGPHSPITPHTPMATRQLSSASHPLRTPYTPFTAFASKQNPFDVSYGAALPSVHLLDDLDDPLAGLYNQILRFVERDLMKIMEVAEKISSKSVPIPGASSSETKSKNGASQQSFEIMANVVWAEIGQAIIDELGGTVFSAGRPAEFRKHHETTQGFIRSLEFLAPSMRSVQAMRAHPVHLAFERRWQLPVYFQLRWKEIVVKLEDVLLNTRSSDNKDRQPFATAQAEAVWEAILTCWSADVYIPQLSSRFWRLTLQLLSRYKTWLDETLPPLEITSKATTFPIEKLANTPQISRTATPTPASSEAPSADAIAADEALLRQFAGAIVDINSLTAKVRELWAEEMSAMLPETANGEGESEGVITHNALEYALSRLGSLVHQISRQIIEILARRCCDSLLPVRFIPSQFRAMVNKRSPTEPSHFVPSILQPIRTFFALGTNGGVGSSLRDDYLNVFAEEVFEAVCERYNQYLSAMKKTEESLRRLKKGQTSTFSLFRNANSNAKDEETRDQERIRTQMIIDVNAFAKEAESVGVDVLGSHAFGLLNEVARTSLSED